MRPNSPLFTDRGSVPGRGDAMVLAIRLRLPGLWGQAAQPGQDPCALPMHRLSAADIFDRRNDFRLDQGATVDMVLRHVLPDPEQGSEVDPAGETTGVGLLVGSAAAPTS
jgi:hypothetical protein